MPTPSSPVDKSPVRLPARRRLLWESHADIIRINKVLLGANIVLSASLAVALGVILSIFTRPMPVLTDDRGYVLYHTTEAYKLTPARVRAYLDSTLTKLLTVNPGFYDLTPLEGLVSPNVISTFSEASAKQSGLRLETDLRQIYDIYEIRKFDNRQYPDLLNFFVRGERTVYQRQTDNAGNVLTVPQSQIMFWSVFISQVPPSPENPWGLKFLGANPMPPKEADLYWNQASPMEGEKK